MLNEKADEEQRQSVAMSLLALADALGCTQEEGAYVIGFAPATISAWRSGRRTPKASTLDSLRMGVARLVEKRLLAIHRILALSVEIDDGATDAVLARGMVAPLKDLVEAVSDVVHAAEAREREARALEARAGEFGVSPEALQATLDVQAGYAGQMPPEIRKAFGGDDEPQP